MTTTRSDNESSLDAGVVCATGESDMAQEYYRLELTSTTLRVTTLFALLPGPEVRVMMARSGGSPEFAASPTRETNGLQTDIARLGTSLGKAFRKQYDVKSIQSER